MTTINSASKTATAASHALAMLTDLIPWETLTTEERFVIDEALQRLYEIKKENETN